MSNFIFIVQFELDTPIYLTDGHRDFTYGGKVYQSGKLYIGESIVEKAVPTAHSFSIPMSAEDQTLVSAFANHPYKNKRCLITKLTLNDDQTVSNAEVWFDGEITKYTYTNSVKQSVISVSVSSIFASFENIKQKDLKILFADTINNDETLYWGKKSPVTVTPTPDRSPRPTDIPTLP